MKFNFCKRFVERNGEADYLDIIPGDGGCYAIIPYRPGGGRHEVGLEQNGCVTLKITVHELLHALGIKHEQCRLVINYIYQHLPTLFFSKGQIVMTTSLSIGPTFVLAALPSTCETPGHRMRNQTFLPNARQPGPPEKTCKIATQDGGWPFFVICNGVCDCIAFWKPPPIVNLDLIF